MYMYIYIYIYICRYVYVYICKYACILGMRWRFSHEHLYIPPLLVDSHSSWIQGARGDGWQIQSFNTTRFLTKKWDFERCFSSGWDPDSLAAIKSTDADLKVRFWKRIILWMRPNLPDFYQTHFALQVGFWFFCLFKWTRSPWLMLWILTTIWVYHPFDKSR